MSNMTIRTQLQAVRDELAKQGESLSPVDWKELLEELSADIEGHLDAIEDESE